jgi:hypothetical protein
MTLNKNIVTMVWIKFCLEVLNADLIDVGYYKNENENVLKNCKENLECSERLTYKHGKVEATEENLKILEGYYATYWKNNSCQSENEPCGSMWGQCCLNMVCQYLSDQPDMNKNFLNEKIGLCSDPNIKYSIP